MGTGILILQGTWNDKTKMMELKGKMTDPMSGKYTMFRETFLMMDPNKQVMKQFGTKNGKEYQTMEILFTRAN